MTAVPIGRALRDLADADPGAPAVRDRHTGLARADLVDAAARYATALREAGVRPDDLVTIRLPNTVEHVVATCAVWMAGATPQPLVGGLALDEQRAIVELADSRVVLGAEPGEFPGRATLPVGLDLRDVEPAPPSDAAAASWKAPASSGSTGRPKLVLATAPARIDPDRPVAAFIPRHATQLVVAPLSHSAPFTYAYRGLMTGHALVLEPRFDPTATLAAIAEHRITWTMLVPTMMHRLLRLPTADRAAADWSSVESILHIGAPCPPEVKRAFLDWVGPSKVVEVYAGSESAGLTMIRGDEWLAHPGSVGRPIGGSRMRIVDAAGAELPPGEPGLIQMRRDGDVPYRYRGAEPVVDDGWHTLGDTGRIDADGYLFVEERRSDLIPVGGEKVAPARVEAVALAHPAVRSALAVGIPDADLGEVVGLVLDLDDPSADAVGIARWIGMRLERPARPRMVLTHDAPLRDDAGKARRTAWRAALQERGTVIPPSAG